MSRLKSAGFSFGASPISDGLSNPNELLLTFDDGYQHLTDVLPPLIASFHFRPIIFVPTKFIGKTNSWDYSHLLRPTPHLDAPSIRSLSALGVEFGSHSHTHCDLTRCDKAALTSELLRSKAILEDVLGKPVCCISYPFGRYNGRVIQAVAEAGYTRGFTMRFPESSDTALSMGRYAVYGYDSTSSVMRKLSRGPFYNIEKWKARLTNKLSGGTVILDRVVRRERSE
ncbi:MAG TPA: polysaccharide deacetylase family protein [Candidatus Deferrimicrobium sp.]|nr:polysaccharide deacetylase family protein [Candidatus Deferrimicrobium sp.]